MKVPGFSTFLTENNVSLLKVGDVVSNNNKLYIITQITSNEAFCRPTTNSGIVFQLNDLVKVSDYGIKELKR